MSFRDIEQQLKSFYLAITPTSNIVLRRKIKHSSLKYFRRQKHDRYQSILALWRYRFSFAFSLFLVVGLLGFIQSSIRDQQLLAGEIKPLNGPVEIIRGTESLFVENPVEVFVGDVIKTGNHGEVKISIPNEFISIAKNKTKFRITNKKALFLDKGVLKNKAQKGLEVATDRGFIKGNPGGSFDIMVSETGETQVLPQKNSVQVFDLWDGKVILNPGESVRLRSDTRLTNESIPSDLKLSNTQLSSIKSKLTIARSKILTGVEYSISGDHPMARNNFKSAEKTFISIIQVLKTSRELEISRRKNLSTLKVSAVFPAMKKRVEEAALLTEIKSIEILFTILSKNKSNLIIAKSKTGVESFDRYVTLKKIIALGTKDQQILVEPLCQKYIVNFLRKIQNKELRIEQIAILNSQVNKLPKNEIAREFLKKVEKLLSKEMSQILDEKIQYRF